MGIVVVEKPITRLPHFGPFSLYIIAQPLENPQVKNLIESLICWNEFQMHNHFYIEKPNKYSLQIGY